MPTRIFFATDVHGSEICWKKFINAGKFYEADVIILGGDMTGKAVVPIVDIGNNRFRAVLLEQESVLEGRDEVEAMQKRVRSRGYYPYLTTPDEIRALQADPTQLDAIFRRAALQTVEEWLAYAETKLAGSGLRCFVAPGNDDMFELDDLIRTSEHVTLAEGRVVHLDDNHEMISSGWSNRTPWHTFREESEADLRRRYQAMLDEVQDMSNCVFNIHVPPFDSTLDAAPELTDDLRPKRAGQYLVPVGSHAVREIIEENQPLLGLFGHIHESKGTVRLGRTLCINPGSVYEQGSLLGAVVNLAPGKVESYILTTG